MNRVSAQEIIKPFDVRYKTEQRGGIVYVSNNILSCNGCSAVNQMPPSGTSDNNDFYSKYIDIDGLPETFSSSSANLNLPDCSSITFAGLYWGGSAKAGNPKLADKNKVKLKLPGIPGYTDLTADVDFGIFESRHYQYFKDITSLVNGLAVSNGTYTVANVVADEADRGAEAGWTLVIAYRQDLMPVRNLTVFDGFAGIPSNAPDLNINLNGFLTPPNGPVSFELGFVAYEGDRGLTNDYMLFNGQNINDAAHSSRNTFNSSITRNGSVVTTRNPAYNNTLGYDASIISPDNTTFKYLSNSATSARVTVATDEDRYAIGVVSTAIDVYNPFFRFTHQFNNLSGSAQLIKPKDELSFEYSITNIGIDQSTRTVFVDSIPPAFQFVPGSFEVQYNNGSWITKTDAALDDEFDFHAVGNRVVFRMGNGANSTTGGAVNSNTDINIRYKAILTDDCDLLRCTGENVSKFGQLHYSGNINNTNSWTVNSTPVPQAGECSAVGPLSLNIDIPEACRAAPADRDFIVDCVTDVSDFLLPPGYSLYAENDTTFLTPLAKVSEAGRYRAHRLVASGCEVIFNVNIDVDGVTILNQPASKIVCEGDSANFTVNVAGRNLTYQWQTDNGTNNWTNLGNAVGNTFSLSSVAANQSGFKYRLKIFDRCGNIFTSVEAHLTVNRKAAIVAQPVSVTICEGENAAFSVAATGDSLVYQWQTETDGSWANIPDATNATFGLTSVPATQNGAKYRVLVTDNCGNTLTSAEAHLTVNKKAAIVAQPVSVAICEGENAAFSVAATGDSLVYQWQTETGGSWTNIPDATNATFRLTSVPATQNGAKYRALVTDNCGNTLPSAEAHLTVNKKAAIVAQPVSVTICEGQNAAFSVAATGDSLVYQWQTETGGSWANIPDATNATFRLTSVPATQNGAKYRVLVTDNCGNTLTSAEAHLTVNRKAAIVAQPVSVAICEGENAAFSVAATGDSLVYQWQTETGGSWANIPDATNATFRLPSVPATQNGAKYRVLVTDNCGNTLTSAEAHLTVNKKAAIVAQPVSVTICEGENAEFSVAATGDSLVYQWQTETVGSWTNIPDATNATFRLTSVPATQNGAKYRALVTDNCGNTLTSAEAHLTVNKKAAIVAQPVSVTICEGENAAFSVAATGDSLVYQWQTETGGSWANIPDATNATFRLTSVPATENGAKYRVLVTDKCRSVISSAVSLVVNRAPIASPDLFELIQGETLNGNIGKNDTDPDGDVPKFSIVSPTENGKLELNSDGSFTFTPNSDWFGTTTGSYTISDGNCTDQALVTFKVLKYQHPPAANNDHNKTTKNTPISFSVTDNDTDIDGSVDTASVSIIAAPGNGNVAVHPNGTVTYIPVRDFAGTDSFTYSVKDNENNRSNVATVIVVISENKTPPEAKDDHFQMEMGAALTASVAINDTNIPTGKLTFSQTSEVKNGTLSFSPDGAFTYTPNKEFFGAESFAYEVCNEFGLCASARVEIKVTPFTIVNLSPALSAVKEGGKVTITATMMRPFDQDVTLTLSYSGKADKEKDYHLADQYLTIRIPMGQLNTSEKITILTSIDNMEEGDEDIVIRIESTSNPAVRIGTGAVVVISDIYPSVPNISHPVVIEGPGNSEITPEPFVSPNGDTHNEYFQIRNIDDFPDNEVVIFNRWGNEVFRVKGYNVASGNVFKGIANKGLMTNENEQLADGVYYYIITTRSVADGQQVSKMHKGYLILKRQ